MIKIYNYNMGTATYLGFVYSDTKEMINVNGKRLYDSFNQFFEYVDKSRISSRKYDSLIYNTVINALENGDNEKVTFIMDIENITELMNLKTTHPELFI